MVQGDAQGATPARHRGSLRALAYNSGMGSTPPGGSSGNGSKPRDTTPRAPAPSGGPAPARPFSAADPLAANSPRPTIPCPKCGAPARDVARFCQHCHMTLRFECPSCHHEQRTGGKCEKCGVDFLKYITAVVAAKQAESDAVEERNERRS
ncbi:MAG: zinc-ribbon domain-containing protein, partial [Candidatus Acidiferrales bacterium]